VGVTISECDDEGRFVIVVVADVVLTSDPVAVTETVKVRVPEVVWVISLVISAVSVSVRTTLGVVVVSIATACVTLNGTSHSRVPSYTPPANAPGVKVNAIGQSRYPVIDPSVTLTATTWSAVLGTIQTRAPS
jgi:hypothetical protein